MASTTGSGSAARHGELWGARARDWAANEDQQTPTYEEAIRRVGIEPGRLVLDIGCGSGAFVRLAADRGARAFGIDASEALIELARIRTPEADLRVGEMQALPYDDDSFDVVTGFNSFFFADDIVAALREAGRVAKPGAPVVIQVWGPPERCDLSAMRAAIAPFLPAPEPGAPAPPELWRPGVLEQIAERAGLTPADAFDASWAFHYADEAALARAMLSPGLAVKAIRDFGEDTVRSAILDALAQKRTPDGGYRLSNEWHYAVARA
jgi:ubiquinone/menaquinone biosynthesis C-methylase UbiE